MKYVISFLSCFFLCIVFSIPTMGKETNISIALAVPQDQTNVPANVLKVLRSRLSSAMAKADLGMANYSGIVLIPDLTITGQTSVEGGMRTITVFDISLSLSVVQTITGMEFHSTHFSLRGEGYDRNEAFMTAVLSLEAKDQKLSDFLLQTKNKVLSYYKDNTSVILTKAKTLSKMGNYDEAIALLSSYPETLADYPQIASAMQEVYSQYQQHTCAQLLQQARGAYATGDYAHCVAYLNEVDMTSPCASEAKALAQKVQVAVGQEKAEVIALYKEEMRTAATIEKRRLQAVENIATSYFENQSEYYFIF